MALDLTLCIVPRQVETIFNKASYNSEYAEWVHTIPTILNYEKFEDWGDETILQVKQDVLQLRDYFNKHELDYYHDRNRCASTLDYLLNELIKSSGYKIQEDIIINGGKKVSDSITSGQGIPLRIYNRNQIREIDSFFTSIDFEKINTYYNYERMENNGVYKLTRQENTSIIKEDFERIKTLFNKANNNDNLLVLKIIN